MEVPGLCFTPADSEIAVLKEALRTQHHILQKLYTELDQEREASSTAANEALSMILRLQGEKAMEKMEAHQYKRMAEEKMQHTQETLSVFEDLMYRKEMEIASLEFQVEAYRHKLLSLGLDDIEIGKPRLLGNPCCRSSDYLPLCEAHDCSTKGVSGHVKVRRHTSLPIMRSKDSRMEKGVFGGEEPCFQQGKFIQRESGKEFEQEFVVPRETAQTGAANRLEKKSDLEKLSRVGENAPVVFEEHAMEDCNSHWERIKQLDGQVKELLDGTAPEEGFDSTWVSTNKELQRNISTDSASLKVGSTSCSWYSAVSSDPFYDSTRASTGSKIKNGGMFSCSSSQAEHQDKFSEFDCHSPHLGRERSRDTSHTASFHDVFEVLPKDPRNYKQCEFDTMPEEIKKPDFSEECIMEAPICAHHENKSPKPRNGVACDYDWVVAVPKNAFAPFHFEVQRINKWPELLEDDRKIPKQETHGKEELKLLREICERLNTIETQIKCPRTKKKPVKEDSSLISVMEGCCFKI